MIDFWAPKRFWVHNKANAFCSVRSWLVTLGLLGEILQDDVGLCAVMALIGSERSGRTGPPLKTAQK